MMNTQLHVLLGDQLAGRVTRHPGGTLSFEYDHSYRAHRDATALSVSMPIQVNTHPDRLIGWRPHLAEPAP